jgi:(1->4)-alpha-D-glucan 1-alpha-D-glucosylmutase
VLSERPERWAELTRAWLQRHEAYKSGGLPDRNAEYLLYQTVVGAWPIELPRVLAYMEKASREAKAYTSWTDPAPAYDTALRSFVQRVLGDDDFQNEVEAFVKEIEVPGRVNGLAQTLLKLTAPGVPDVYQGTELWDHSLVDPDNRRPVDFALRRRLLSEVRDMSAQEAWRRIEEGVPKLWLTERALRLRKERPAAFGAEGRYRPLAVTGAHSSRVVAFARGGDVVTVVPRLTARLSSWSDTALSLPEGAWRSALTGERCARSATLADLFDAFPVALLAREERP